MPRPWDRGGAVTDNVLRPWDRGGGVVIPAQADSLNAGTDLVTLSIGGNDINFGAIASCFFEVAQDPNATPCKGRLEDDINQRYAALPANADQHTACADSAQRWVDGSGRLTNSHSMHPTALGQKVMADAVVGAI